MAFSLKQVLVAFTIVAGGLASPVSSPRDAASGPGRFTLRQVQNPNYNFVGPLSIKKTYLKYGKAVPEAVEDAVQKYAPGLSQRATGSATARPIDNYDSAYVTPVQIGTPAQTLNLNFDTGSSDLWVFSTETEASQVNGQTLFDPSRSSTATLLPGETWSIAYGDGSTSSGIVYSDTVTVGGLTVASQAVEVAQEVSQTFTLSSAVHGLLGLAFDSLNTVSTPQKTFFSNALASLDAPLFMTSLDHAAPGTYDFGFIDSRKAQDITYTPVSTARGLWEFTSTGYAIGGDDFVPTSIDAIADTGTTLLYLPDDIVSEYWDAVEGAGYDDDIGGYTFPCTAMLRPFTFGVGSATFQIPSDYMQMGAVAGGSTTCFGGIQSSEGLGINIFGDVALKSAVVVFDASTPQLGFAAKPPMM